MYASYILFCLIPLLMIFISNLDCTIMEFIYNLLHTNNSTVHSIVNSKLLLYLSLIHVLNQFNVPSLSEYESYVHNISYLYYFLSNIYVFKKYNFCLSIYFYYFVINLLK